MKGTIGAHASPRRYSLVVDDPAAVRDRGAACSPPGGRRDDRRRSDPDGHDPERRHAGRILESPPLGQIIGEMDRESINLYAELLFRDAASTGAHPGSAATGLATSASS